MSRISQLSQRYAKALFAAAPHKEKALNELRVIVKIMVEDPMISSFLRSKEFGSSLKKEVIVKSFENRGVSLEVLHFLFLVSEKGRIAALEPILKAFESLVDSENGITRGEVLSATKLAAEARKQIEGVVSHFTRKKVILSYSEDPTLVGGIVARVGGWTFEDTLESHLRRLKEELNRRAN